MRDPQRKARIQETAARLFASEGYEAVTIPRIAREAGAAVGSLTHFFPDKSLLAQAVLNEAAARLAARLGRALEGGGREVASGLVVEIRPT